MSIISRNDQRIGYIADLSTGLGYFTATDCGDPGCEWLGQFWRSWEQAADELAVHLADEHEAGRDE